MGDLGGVMEVVTVFLGIVFYSISQHSYYINMLKKVYFAKTKDDNMFKTSNYKK